MINLPQQTITGLLNGSITRVFEVCDNPRPAKWIEWETPNKDPELRAVDGSLLFNPFGEPGTIHTIGGQQFEVVVSGVKQYKSITEEEWQQAGYIEENLIGAIGRTWLWTAELRRKDDEDE